MAIPFDLIKEVSERGLFSEAQLEKVSDFGDGQWSARVFGDARWEDCCPTSLSSKNEGNSLEMKIEINRLNISPIARRIARKLMSSPKIELFDPSGSNGLGHPLEEEWIWSLTEPDGGRKVSIMSFPKDSPYGEAQRLMVTIWIKEAGDLPSLLWEIKEFFCSL